MCLNGDLSKLEEVVSQMANPGSKIGFLCNSTQEMVNIHSGNCCDYFGVKEAIGKFKNELAGDFTMIEEGGGDEQELNLSANDQVAGPSNMLTSSQNVSADFNDIGIAGSCDQTTDSISDIDGIE
eukprot:GFUD01128718.1.p1 GENE.GFUD01128718.1~~GFUD01128718.1.p1  ORF type:complete len:125 (+),score=33.55 GFUD01128718.1:64-438(+)